MEISNSTKLATVRSILCDRGVRIWNDVSVKEMGITIPLFIPDYNISVFYDDSIYKIVSHYTHPVFIRADDTIDFVMAKIRNTMATPPGRIFKNRQVKFFGMLCPADKSDSSVIPGKRHRKRIRLVRVTPSD